MLESLFNKVEISKNTFSYRTPQVAASIEENIRPIIFFKSSHWRCSVKKGALRNFANFTGKHLCQKRFFNKVAGLRGYQKRVSGTGVFLWILRNFSEYLFLLNTSGGCFCFFKVYRTIKKYRPKIFW